MLIDFGVAKELSGSVLTRVGTVTGTPGYAAPEQMQGHVFPASDLYSLGVTCIRLLTGCLLEEKNGTLADELFDPMQMEWVWRNKALSISNDLGKVLDKMLLFPVGARYQSAAEVLQALNPVSVSPNQISANQVMPKQTVSEIMLKQVANEGMPKQQTNEVQLVYAVGMDYRKLRDLLAAGKWKEADKETARVMIKMAGREQQGCLNDSSIIDKFPCEDLRTIDQLWVKYSNGRFGFSVQKRIYQSLGGSREYDIKIWEAFGERIGWRNKNEWLYYNNVTFSEKAPEAHLPVGSLGWGVGGGWVRCGLGGLVWGSLLSRRDL